MFIFLDKLVMSANDSFHWVYANSTRGEDQGVLALHTLEYNKWHLKKDTSAYIQDKQPVAFPL